jgi:hypothetical protein
MRLSCDKLLPFALRGHGSGGRYSPGNFYKQEQSGSGTSAIKGSFHPVELSVGG